MAAATEARKIDARRVDAQGLRHMIDQPVEPRDVPVLVAAKKRRNGDEGEIRRPLGDLRRAVHLHLFKILAPLARSVKKDEERPARTRIGAVPAGEKELIGIIARLD